MRGVTLARKLSFRPTIARPCEELWAEMRGTARERHCGLCDRQVHNLASLTSREIDRLVLEKDGKLCARITQREDGSLVTLDGGSRVSFAAQIVAAASLALGAAGAMAQSASEKHSKSDAVLTGTVMKPDGFGPMSAAVVSIRTAGLEVATTKADERGEFRIAVSPGTYDVYLRGNPFFGARIAGASLHSGEQTVGSVKTHFSYAGQEDGGQNGFATIGVMVSSIRYPLKWAVRHPILYLKHLARKI